MHNVECRRDRRNREKLFSDENAEIKRFSKHVGGSRMEAKNMRSGFSFTAQQNTRVRVEGAGGRKNVVKPTSEREQQQQKLRIIHVVSRKIESFHSL